MLPKKNRISRKDFPAHKVQGLRVFMSLFTVVFYKTNSSRPVGLRPSRESTDSESADSESRASVVVSKKTAKTAVVRNKLRRRFYELLAPYFRIIPAPTIVVVYPKSEAINAQFSALNEEMQNAFKKAKII